MELKHANNDVLGNEDGFLKDSESFKKHCAMVLVHLKEACSLTCGFHCLVSFSFLVSNLFLNF